MRASLAVFRRAFGGVIGVASSATITRRASWPDFLTRRTVAPPMVSVSPTFRSILILFMANLLLFRVCAESRRLCRQVPALQGE